VDQSTKEKDRLLQAYLITRPICIILPLCKAIIFIAYNYITITSDIDIKIHIQSMLISLQIKEIVWTLSEKPGQSLNCLSIVWKVWSHSELSWYVWRWLDTFWTVWTCLNLSELVWTHSELSQQSGFFSNILNCFILVWTNII
jgi:hypothetical protein